MDKNIMNSYFQDTMDLSQAKALEDATFAACNSNKIYKENFFSATGKTFSDTKIIVEENTSFGAAGKYRQYGKTAVLNFANPQFPGGGANNRGKSQEQYLCSRSNLFACLSDEAVFDDFYEYHRNFGHHFFSDRLIYTSGVTVFKTDDEEPQMMKLSDWFTVDVITCAAPYLGERVYTNLTALKSLFKKRIRNILEAAKDNEAAVLILGAFGCGAFKNPPRIVAEAFQEVIHEKQYRHCFSHIVFALKSSGENNDNFKTFYDQFLVDLQESESCLLCAPPEYRFYRAPKLNYESHIKKDKEFRRWQGKNPYFGKQFSVLGDSISTLKGFHPEGYRVFYEGENCERSNIKKMSDTWWGKVIDFFGGELLVNNSWSGSRVAKLPENKQLFPSGCSDERTGGLHINEVMPDVIMIDLGVNDWIFSSSLSFETRLLSSSEMEYFSSAYAEMLRKLKNNYPKAEIWCFTIPSAYMSVNPDYVFPEVQGGNPLQYYNSEIRGNAVMQDCRLIDFDEIGLLYDSIDGTHPSSDGMNTLAVSIIRSVADKEGSGFLNCLPAEHDFVEIKAADDMKYQCRKCGMKTNELIFRENHEDAAHLSFYSRKVKRTYPDSIQLYDLDENREVSIPQTTSFSVGRKADAVQWCLQEITISRVHVIFSYEDGTWYLTDNHSKNGTWINNVKLQPDLKYELYANDIIDFAHSKKVVFFPNEAQNPLEDETVVISDKHDGQEGAFEAENNIEEKVNAGEIKEEVSAAAEQVEEESDVTEHAEEMPAAAEQVEEKADVEERVEELPVVTEQVEVVPDIEESVEEASAAAEQMEEAHDIEESVEELPAAAEQVEEVPDIEESVEELSAAAEQVEEAPAAAEQVEETPDIEESVEEMPVAAEQVEEAPVAAEQIEEAPDIEESVEESPVVAEQVEEESIAEEQLEEEVDVEESVEEEPTAAEQVKEAPAAAADSAKEKLYQNEDISIQPNWKPSQTKDEKYLKLLEMSIEKFTASDYTDQYAYQCIFLGLSKAPMYFPVDIDVEAMFGNIDFQELKKGDMVQSVQDTRIKILTLIMSNGEEVVPMFTSKSEISNVEEVSIIHQHPQDYIEQLIQMGKRVVINPFSSQRFLMNQQVIKEILLPLIEDAPKAENILKQSEDKKKAETQETVKKAEKPAKEISREPAKEAEKPVTAINQEPANEAEEPAKEINREPAKEAEKPVTAVNQEPIKEVEEPAAVINQEPVKEAEERTTVINREPAKEAEEPAAAIDQEPAKEAEKPAAAIIQEPIKEAEEPAAVINQEPIKEAEEPAKVIIRKPAKEAEKPVTVIQDEENEADKLIEMLSQEAGREEERTEPMKSEEERPEISAESYEQPEPWLEDGIYEAGQLTGKVIDGKYKLTDFLGGGKIAEIYLAEEKDSQELYAIKICEDQRYEELVQTEAEIMCNVGGVPGIKEISRSKEGYLYIVMEYIRGESLESLIVKNGPLPEQYMMFWMQQLCSIVSGLHNMRPPFIHGDLNTSNIFLTPDGQMKLMNLGMLCGNSLEEEEEGTTVLNYNIFEAPELRSGGQKNVETDMYSIGIMMYHLLTGVNPRGLQLPLKPLCEANPQLSKGLEIIFQKCIAQPGSRYRSCEEFLADLERYPNLHPPKKKGLFGKLFKK